MKTSEIKTADSTSEECFGVSVVKISAQSDKTKEMLSVAQFATMHENPVLRKTRKEKFEGRFIRILWAVSYGESDEHIF